MFRHLDYSNYLLVEMFYVKEAQVYLGVALLTLQDIRDASIKSV